MFVNLNCYGVIVWFCLSPPARSCESLWELLRAPCIELLRCQGFWFWGVDDYSFFDMLAWSVWAREESFAGGKAGSRWPVPMGFICALADPPGPVFDCRFDPPMLEFLLATCFFFFCAVIYDKSERMRIRFCFRTLRSYWVLISLHYCSVIAVPVRSEFIPGPPAVAVFLCFWAADSDLWISFLLLRVSVLKPFRNLLSWPMEYSSSWITMSRFSYLIFFYVWNLTFARLLGLIFFFVVLSLSIL